MAAVDPGARQLEADPVDPFDAATRRYVDGRSPKIAAQDEPPTDPEVEIWIDTDAPRFTVGTNPFGTPREGDVWLDTDAPRFFASTSAPSGPVQGDVWLDLGSL